jgi:7-cyano-7-deazaguanine reductase
MADIENSPLGKPTSYTDQYDATLLCPIPRAGQRASLGVGDAMPFFGADMWTAYELSWLNPRGKPQVAIAHITVPSESPNIVESKSLKLYLNSLNNTRFADAREVRERIRGDLNALLGASIGIKTLGPELFDLEPIHELDGLNLDRLDVECLHYSPAPELLFADTGVAPIEQTLCSNLLKSNCLITSQPDWGSIQISYSGHPIDQEGLLQYLVSFRGHNEFHEHCVERIFMDIWTRCRPTRLTVYARYTRRGGLDISPFRCSHPQALPPNVRTARQ